MTDLIPILIKTIDQFQNWFTLLFIFKKKNWSTPTVASPCALFAKHIWAINSRPLLRESESLLRPDENCLMANGRGCWSMKHEIDMYFT